MTILLLYLDTHVFLGNGHVFLWDIVLININDVTVGNETIFFSKCKFSEPVI